jgi:HAD superfamily hydrolase (TIGR01549 family)
MPMLPPGQLRALVFDLDGVILDSQRLMRHALAESFRQHCGPESPPYEGFFELMGLPLEGILSRLGLPREMAGTYRRVSRENLHLAAPYPGVEELLALTRARGLRVGLMTGKDRDRTEELLCLFQLRESFEVLVCGDDPLPSKPAPGGLLALLASLGERPEHSALIGDSRHDIACARAAGVMALGAGWGFSPAQELNESGARITFPRPGAFAEWLSSHVEERPQPMERHGGRKYG